MRRAERDRLLPSIGVGLGITALLAVSVAGSEPLRPNLGTWFLEFHEETFEQACTLANEPGLELATVWHCQSNGAESYMVRVGPAADRTELDAIRERYLSRQKLSLILPEDSCKTMEKQSCPVGRRQAIRQSLIGVPATSN